jgi:hypothetical protein
MTPLEISRSIISWAIRIIVAPIFILWVLQIAAVVPFILILSLLSPNLSTLSCIRGESSQVSCVFISSGILGTYTTHLPSGKLQSAEVDKICADAHCRYDIFNENIDKIDLFIKNKEQKTLILTKDKRWDIIGTVITWVLFFSFISEWRSKYY